MTNSRTIDAAASARLRETQLTEIAQGDIPKLTEALVNRDTLPGGLTGIFQVAVSVVDSDNRLKTQEVFNQQQQQKTEQQQQDQEKKDKEEQDNWLDAMSPEYREAYGKLMDTVGDADKQYDQMRQRLIAQRQQLDKNGQEIDNKALHLKDGSRVYANAQGELVDKDGKSLGDKARQEAQALLRQQGNPRIGSYEAYHQNHDDIIRNDKGMGMVNAGETQANNIGANARAHDVPDTAGLNKGNTTVKTTLATTQTFVGTTQNNKSIAPTAPVSVADFGVDGDDAAPASISTNRSSYASHIDDKGIATQSASNAFNTVSQNVIPAPIPTQQKPQVAASAPSP